MEKSWGDHDLEMPVVRCVVVHQKAVELVVLTFAKADTSVYGRYSSGQSGPVELVYCSRCESLGR